MSDIIRVGLSQGDQNGVGMEVILKSIADPVVTELFTPVIFGVPSIALKCKEMLGLSEMRINIISDMQQIVDGKINLFAVSKQEMAPDPGKVSKESGAMASKALVAAVDALKEGAVDVLVTAPISKEAIQSKDFPFPGHTEFLENRLGEGDKASMILCNDSLRVALLSIHVPIAKVPELITKERIIDSVMAFSDTLKRDFGKERPSIAVLSLNPHAGDGGVIGDEEEEIIKPALRDLRNEGTLAFGPFPADGFFGHGAYKNYDGVLAMYHDQGLAPFKTIASSGGVNFTAGLPFVRTSPDHGTAFDIAWKGIADESSMRDAIYMAIDIFRRRNIFDDASANPLKKYVTEKPDRGERQDKPLKLTNISDLTDD